ncbi:hypothetical protein GCM10027053_29060 [Intrasporangium mesophilum]
MGMMVPVRVGQQGPYAVRLQPRPQLAHESLRTWVEQEAERERHGHIVAGRLHTRSGPQNT